MRAAQHIGSLCGFALLLGATSLLPAQAQDDAAEAKRGLRRLTVTGQGEIKARPDKAEITIGVVTENRSSKEAAKSNAEKSQAVQSALKRLNILDKDIQTVNYSINPLYAEQQGGVAANRKPAIIGYRVYNQVRVTIHNLPQMSDVIDAATNAESNTIEGISFGLEDEKSSLDSAIDKAVADARRKADRLVRAAGATIAGIYEISEGGFVRPMPMMMGRAVAADAGASTPIQSGELTVSANVTIVYQLSPVLKGVRNTGAKVQRAAKR